MPTAEFEQFLYNSPGVEHLLGRTAYLDLLETDYASKQSAAEARRRVATELARVDAQACGCASWRNDMKVPLGYESDVEWFSSHFHVLARRTPWLEHVRCKLCETDWYVATDTVDDDYYFHRMTAEEIAGMSTGVWPATFDKLEAAWPSQEWLELFGYQSLEEWRRENGAA